MRETIKRLVEGTLVVSGAARVARRRRADRVLILAYHNVVPDDAPLVGDVANHLPLSKFVAQMRTVARTHDVVPIAEALGPSGRRTRPRVAITFDDAYLGAVQLALPRLVELGMPATVFVAPGFVGGGSFWWDALAAPGGGLDPDIRRHALETLRGEDGAVREWARATGRAIAEVPPLLRAASVEELVAAAALPGITIGAHTWGHPNLTRLDAAELAHEMAAPLAWVARHVTTPVRWLAYPYGFFDARVAAAAAAAGYDAALAVSGGWVPAGGTDRFAVPRVNIPRGLSLQGFTLRAAGLLT